MTGALSMINYSICKIQQMLSIIPSICILNLDCTKPYVCYSNKIFIPLHHREDFENRQVA